MFRNNKKVGIDLGKHSDSIVVINNTFDNSQLRRMKQMLDDDDAEDTPYTEFIRPI